MGVLRVENGDLRFTGYGLFRLIMPLLGILGFLVWHVYSGVQARSEYRQFQQSAAVLERGIRKSFADVDARSEAVRDALRHWYPSDPRTPNYLIDDIRARLDKRRYASIGAVLRESPTDFETDADAAPWQALQRSINELTAARDKVRAAVDAVARNLDRVPSGRLSDDDERLLQAVSDATDQARHALDWHENPDVLYTNLESTSWDRARERIEPLCRALAAVQP